MKVQQKLAIGIIRARINLLALMSTKKAAEEAFRLFCTPLGKNTIKPKSLFENAEQHSFVLDNKRIHGFRFNHPQQKKILLLHGFSSSTVNFDMYVQPLIDKRYEVLAFDAPAHGKSEGKTVNAVDYAAVIRKVVELYGPVHAFLAHSFGGLAISLAMETMPHDADTKIVLIAPATETTSAIDGAFAMLGIKNKKIRQEFDAIVEEKGGHPPAWFSVRRAMQHIKASVLWFHDEDDDITPLADALAVKTDNLPNVKFVITSRLGHRKIYRVQSVIDRIMQFL